MKTLKNALISLALLASTSSILFAAPTFEQTGVKEGNNKLSVSIYNRLPKDGDASVTLNAELGHFLTDDIELTFNTLISKNGGSTLYYLQPGANYYFAKTPTLTPYVGGQVYYYGLTGSDTSGFGNNYHVGAHKFFSENVSITGEAGLDFFELTDYSQSYTNIYFTYFFN